MKKRLSLVVLASVLCFGLHAQVSDDGIWHFCSEGSVSVTGKRQIVPQKYRNASVNLQALTALLNSAPHEQHLQMALSPCILYLPLPNGSFGRFRVLYSPMMARELEVAFPQIKTFNVKGVDDPHATGKLDLTDAGFHGMVFSPDGDFFIDPYCLNNTTNYISYYTTDFVKPLSDVVPEAGLITDGRTQGKPAGNVSVTNSQQAAAACVGAQLRTYRLAVACTGEYAQAATGQGAPTVAQTLARIVTSVNRVNGVYEKEVSIRLSLVATNTLVVFTSPASDPFNGNNNANTLINESQSVINSNIGSSNYDIGHTFSSGGGGLANLGCVCSTNNKAKGITGSSNPVGDPYDIDYVAHEIGHQFGAEHTFNAITGSCSGNRSASTSAEPGSGVTIMGYAGLCGTNDLAGNSIPYFHAVSYDQIVNFASSFSGNCAVVSATGNQPPTVSAPSGLIVPVSTPFILSGSAADPNGDALTYSWEQIDPGTSSGNWNSGNRPYFRSYAPVTSATRLFPNATVVASGNYTGTRGEYLPASAQTLNFRLTARDNKAGGGGVCSSNIAVTVDAAGPFTVSYPSAVGISWISGSTQNITWDVNGTDQFPIAADSVRILISYNSGTTYTTLVGSARNNGIRTVSVPLVPNNIGTCRIRIEAKGNVFYDISDNNFLILVPGDDTGLQAASESNTLGLRVWPNPASSTVHVELGQLDSKSATVIRVSDMLGKTVLVKDLGYRDFAKEQLDASMLPPGVYFVTASNNGQQSVHRFIKD